MKTTHLVHTFCQQHAFSLRNYPTCLWQLGIHSAYSVPLFTCPVAQAIGERVAQGGRRAAVVMQAERCCWRTARWFFHHEDPLKSLLFQRMYDARLCAVLLKCLKDHLWNTTVLLLSFIRFASPVFCTVNMLRSAHSKSKASFHITWECLWKKRWFSWQHGHLGADYDAARKGSNHLGLISDHCIAILAVRN